MQTVAIDGGFDAAPIQSAQAFRGIMNAMARPGTIETVTGANPPAPLSVAAGTAILTLCDHDTQIALCPTYDTPQVREWIAFHTSAPIGPAETAMFIIGPWGEIPLARLPIGTPEYPDRSTTCIVDGHDFDGAKATLSGPGIKETAELALPETTPFQNNTLLFPLGLDFFFTADDRIAGLPRSTKVR